MIYFGLQIPFKGLEAPHLCSNLAYKDLQILEHSKPVEYTDLAISNIWNDHPLY